MGFLKKNKGWDCSTNQDGTKTCVRYVVDKNGQKVTTGTQVTIGADSSNNCEPYISGDVASILDDEAEDVNVISKRIVAGCKRGLVN